MAKKAGIFASVLPEPERPAAIEIGPVQKLLQGGFADLKQEELLAVFLDSAGASPREALDSANLILNEYIGLYGLSRKKATAAALQEVAGLKEVEAKRICAAVALAQEACAAKGIRLSRAPAGPGELELWEEIVASEETAARLGDFFGSAGELLSREPEIPAGMQDAEPALLARILATHEIAIRLSRAYSM